MQKERFESKRSFFIQKTPPAEAGGVVVYFAPMAIFWASSCCAESMGRRTP